jgi:hypothetical protein
MSDPTLDPAVANMLHALVSDRDFRLDLDELAVDVIDVIVPFLKKHERFLRQHVLTEEHGEYGTGLVLGWILGYGPADQDARTRSQKLQALMLAVAYGAGVSSTIAAGIERSEKGIHS